MEKRATLSFGALLKRHRRTAGLTQEQLAERSGYSVSYVSMLERGERAPVRATVELLADALALSTQERDLLAAASDDRTPLRIVPNSTGHTRQAPALPPLAGRASEIAHLNQFLAGNAPPLLMFAGEPGIGKSRLLAEAQSLGAASGWEALTGSAQRSGVQQPYTPLLEALERHAAGQPEATLRQILSNAPWLTRLLPELAHLSTPPQAAWTLPPDQERRLIFASVAQYLNAIRGPSGTLLLLDDLQWAGSDALDLLFFLLHSSAAPDLRVVGAYRDSELRQTISLTTFLADLAASGSVERMLLGPLSPGEAASLVTETLPSANHNATAIERVVARGSGVPFYLVSFAQSVANRDDSGTSATSTEDIPWNVAQTIRQRIVALPQPASELLNLIALAERGLRRTVLLTAAKDLADEETLADALDAACRARLLEDDGEDSYLFSHELAREAVLHEIGQARRATLHLRLAEALETSSGEKPVEALAYHFARGDRPERAIPYLSQAAARARDMRAFTAAAARYHDLVETLNQLERQREAVEARIQLGEVLTIAGRYAEAIATLEEAAQTLQTLGERSALDRVTAHLGLAYAASGNAATGITRLEPYAKTAAALHPSAQEHTQLWDALAQLYNVGGRYADQLSATVRASELAEHASDLHLRAQVQMRHGNALRMLGRMREATNILEETIRLASTTNDEQNLTYALENVSVVYLLQGKLQQTNDYVQRALEIAQHLGDPIVLALMTFRRGMTAYVLGNWDAALADYEHAEASMREIGIAWVTSYILIGLGQLKLARGETELGASTLAEAVDLARHSGDLQALRWAQTALAEWDLVEGRPQIARDRLEPLLDHPGQKEGLVTYLLPYLAWACAKTGSPDPARAHIQECFSRAESEHINLALVDALRVNALLTLQSNEPSTDAELLRALDLCHTMPYPYAEAKVHHTLASHLSKSGDTKAAQHHWGAAAKILSTLGEQLYASHIEAALSSTR